MNKENVSNVGNGIFIFLAVLSATFIRILPHYPNFVPISAFAVCLGWRIRGPSSFLFVFLTMFLSDYALGVIWWGNVFYNPLLIYHSTLPYVYFSYGLSAAVGLLLPRDRHVRFPVYLALHIFTATQFFLVTNAGVWLAGAYERGPVGLLHSYTMGIPFYKWTLAADLWYGSLAYIGYLTNSQALWYNWRRTGRVDKQA